MEPLLNTSFTNQSNCTTSSCNNTNEDIYNSLGSAVPIFLTVYALILMFAVTGNGLVCYIVASNRKMHEVTNYLLVNLSVSDLIQALATVFQVADFVVKDLNLGRLLLVFKRNRDYFKKIWHWISREKASMIPVQQERSSRRRFNSFVLELLYFIIVVRNCSFTIHQ